MWRELKNDPRISKGSKENTSSEGGNLEESPERIFFWFNFFFFWLFCAFLSLLFLHFLLLGDASGILGIGGGKSRLKAEKWEIEGFFQLFQHPVFGPEEERKSSFCSFFLHFSPCVFCILKEAPRVFHGNHGILNPS